MSLDAVAFVEFWDLFSGYAFFRRAVYAALVVGLVSSILGVYVVLRGASMLGDGLAHMSLAGVALGFLAGFYPLGGALVAANLGAITIHLLQSRGLLRNDAALGIVFTGGLAAAILLFSVGPGFGTSLDDFLFGNLLAVTNRDLALLAVVLGAMGAALAALHKELFYVTFNPEAARVSGLPVPFLEIAFSMLTASVVVVGVRVVGVLLVSGLLIVPAAAALQLARSFRMAVVLAGFFGVASVLLGLWGATTYRAATGASIALAAVVLFVVAAVASRLPVRRRA